MQRTNQQNKAMHVDFKLICDALNDAGLDQRKVLKPSISIPWTPTAVKEQLWKPIQKALWQKESTTELDKIKEIEHTHDVLLRHLGEKFELEYIEFPHDEKKINATLAPKEHNRTTEYPEYNEAPTI